MFIDDDPLLGMLARVTLERLGHAAETFLDPVSALEAFRISAGCYDLVLCDVRIDRASGFELAREMKQVRPEIPVLMLSGVVEEGDIAAGREIGVLAVLPKSEVMTDLGQALAPYLR
jgi:DNA-binding response OmpR family regulator